MSTATQGIPHGYKSTEQGVLPNDWQIEALQDVCGPTITYGIVQCGPHIEGGVPYIRVSDMNSRSLNVSGMLRTSPAIAAQFSRSTVREGDIVFALRGQIGEVRKVPASVDGANLTQGTARISPNSLVHADYLLWALRGPSSLRQSQLESKGSTFREITLAQIRRIQLPIPPIAEQQAIAEALSDADALIESLEQLLAKKRDIKQGAMQQLLTGKRRLPGFEGEWETRCLGEIARLYQPLTISAKDFSAAGYPVYGANGVVGFYEKTNHETWQITVTCRGSTCGTVNRTVDRCWITGNAMVVNCDDYPEVNKTFLFYLLCNQDLSICITGTGQPQIVRTPLATFELKMPPINEEQTAIAQVLTDMDNEIAAFETKLSKARQIKQGMMQELLTGRIRLV